MFYQFLRYMIFCLCLLIPSLYGDETDLPTSDPFSQYLDVSTSTNDRFMYEFGRMLILLSFIVGIIFALTWVLKRMLQGRIQQVNSTSQIKIIEQRSLNSKSHLYLIEINGRGLALAESVNGITRLGEFPIEKTPQNISTFENMLKK